MISYGGIIYSWVNEIFAIKKNPEENAQEICLGHFYVVLQLGGLGWNCKRELLLKDRSSST